ncbi:expressed unknown protein [Seminavis robusta]|uniref:Uncharacterized protein n=1 Tax=Seminavis robusta TaxID=568900 RepID=A0A9N8DGP3_9STRA|nr:expressed unknown protein [Seminavis robusta]|eukprot:Sro58_g033920.1 n/a (352) ;mRNA; r:130536-131591
MTTPTSNHPLHRPRPKASESSQNPIESEDDSLLPASFSGSVDTVAAYDHDVEHPLKRHKLSQLLAPSKLGIRSFACLILTLLLVLSSLVETGTSVILSSSKGSLRKDPVQCPIQKWTYPNCRPYLAPKNASLGDLSPHEWYDLRRKFEQVVGDEASSLDPSFRTNGSEESLSGFRVPVEVRVSPGKGLGVFTTTPVQKGQVVWDNRFTARFPDECSLRQYFDLIGEKASCDALTWGYVNDFQGEGLKFLLDLDEAVYLNEARKPDEVNLIINFRPLQDDPEYDAVQKLIDPDRFWQHRQKPGNQQARAKVHLQAGAELLMDYREVHVYGKLWWYDRLCFKTRGVWAWLMQI